MKTTIRDTILDGNMGEGWADDYAAAVALAEHTAAAYRSEFGESADIEVRVLRNTAGYTPPLSVESDEDDDALNRAEAVRDRAWESFCANPPAALVA